MGILTGQVAIITGASSGIGRASAKLFAREGAQVVVAARRKKELDAVVAEIAAEAGRAIALAADVQDETFAKALVELRRAVANSPEALSFVSRLHALKRVASPDEIPKSALYLASHYSSFTTGTALLADGGVSINRT